MKIFEINGAGNFSGATRDIEDNEGAPLGWVRAIPPEAGDGQFVAWTGAGWEIFETPPPPDPTIEIAARVKAFEHLVDSETDAIYLAVIGNRGPEYDDAAREAADFKAAGYPANAVPDSVSSWSTPTNKTPQWAADDILATAANLTYAKKQIRLHRLAAKEAARAALGGVEQEPINVAAEQWATFVIAIRAQLKV